jgi:competence protein ComEC
MKTNKKFLNSFVKALLIASMCVLTLCSCTFNINFDNALESSFVPSDDSTDLVVHYLDVGQGDSIFIELPNSQSMLIDAGVSGEGESIESYINDSGYSKIDYLVATHPHADHIGSMTYIVKNIDIGSIYMPKVSTTTKTYEKLLTAISDKGYKVKSATAGMTIVEDSGFSVDILGPEEVDEDDMNNSSIIIKITYGSKSFLFIGDAETEELNTITSDMSADVLKVGHHGSRTSTTEEFLQEVNPEYAVISCGKDNDYGHPHSEVIALLNQFDITYYRTDTQGTIIISSDGSSIDIQTNATSIERKS